MASQYTFQLTNGQYKVIFFIGTTGTCLTRYFDSIGLDTFIKMSIPTQYMYFKVTLFISSDFLSF